MCMRYALLSDKFFHVSILPFFLCSTSCCAQLRAPIHSFSHGTRILSNETTRDRAKPAAECFSAAPRRGGGGFDALLRPHLRSPSSTSSSNAASESEQPAVVRVRRPPVDAGEFAPCRRESMRTSQMPRPVAIASLAAYCGSASSCSLHCSRSNGCTLSMRS